MNPPVSQVTRNMSNNRRIARTDPFCQSLLWKEVSINVPMMAVLLLVSQLEMT